VEWLSLVRRGLVVVGALVWVPYLTLRYGMGREVSPWPVLAVHVPCMLGALGIRLWQAYRKK
jgi:hypothetical protein